MDDDLLALLWAPDTELPGTADASVAQQDKWTDAGAPLDLQELWTETWDELPTSVEALQAETPSSNTRPSTSACLTPPDPRLITLSYGSSARRVTTKQRIQLLKVEAERLQLNLDTMRQQTHQGGSRASTPASMTGGMWQAMAARQQQRREQAEAENKRLRSLEHSQRRHLQSVRRLLGRQPHRQVSISSGDLGCYEVLTDSCMPALLVAGSGGGDQQAERTKCEGNAFRHRPAL